MAAIRPIIIDTDAGWDDWLALLFLMKCVEVDIVGVTVTGVGEANLTPGSKNINELLIFGGQSADVYPGSSKPLIYSNAFPASFRGTIDDLFGLTVPPPPGVVGTSAISSTSAVEFLYQTLVAAAAEGPAIDLLCIGGFTNLAMLLAAHPLAEYEAGIGTIYAMAGAVGVQGNIVTPGDDLWSYYLNEAAEWNVFVDAKGLRVVLVPLDATNCVPVTKSFVAAYGEAAGQDVYAGFIHEILQLQAGETDFFDPLAAAVLLTKSASDLVTVERARLRVETELDEQNNTVGALTSTTDGSWTELTACTGAGATSFEALFSSKTLPVRT
jgi:inosine-uridine nucleoside N-ribohydrolase